MVGVTARTPRQRRAEERAAALLDAAVAVISEAGPAGFSARAVATRARLPLASVSYYYPRLGDLLAAALSVVLDGWLDQAAAVADRPHRAGDRGARAAARLLVAALLPHPPSPAEILCRYEHLLAAARIPTAATALARLRPALGDAVARILDGAGIDTTLPAGTVISLVDGAAVGALSEGVADPAAVVRRELELLLAAGTTAPDRVSPASR